jgi:4-alpha-glucanotransferase
LWRAFVANGNASGDAPPPELTKPVVDAALSFVAATPSPLCLPPIEDLLGIEQQPNLPGTIDEHPNWRRRLGASVDLLLEEADVARRVDRLATQRPRL